MLVVIGRCSCVNVPMGSYANQELIIAPNGKQVGIDRCILAEVQDLWARGVKTLGSCCGHNVAVPWIGVDARSVDPMVTLGYQQISGGQMWDFLAKSVEILQ